jgi:tetratricopeptide (TPR) repeat protein
VVTDPVAERPVAAGELAQAFRTDVFISYSHADRETAAQLAEAFEAQGLLVWWDRNLQAGSEFAEVIETQLQSAHVVIALWSSDSVRSGFVRDESGRALRAGKLLPVRIEDVELPLGFGQLHTLDLIDWSGDAGDATLQQLLAEIRRLKQRGPSPDNGDAGKRRFGRGWRMPRHVLVAVVAVALVLLGYGGKVMWDKDEADSHFRSGLRHQHASEPRLVNALNEYLSALEYRPRHARARYYLAHTYAQLGQPADALESFRLALSSNESPLDRGQRSEAQQQVVALAADPNEAPAMVRSVAATAADEPAPPMRSVTPPVPPRESGAPGKPPRIEPAEAIHSRLASLVDGMFDDNKERRITATTSLVVDPEALSDAVPLALAKAQGVLRARGGAGALTQSGSSGIVNTLVLLQSTLPGTLEANRRAIEELLAATSSLGEHTRQHASKVSELLKLSAVRKPVAYIQIANEAQRPIADAMSTRFRSFGYEAPAVELVGARAPARTELRVQGKSDRGFARWIAKVIADTSGDTAAVSTLRNARPQADAYEIWLDRDLCAPGGRQLAACKIQ